MVPVHYHQYQLSIVMASSPGSQCSIFVGQEFEDFAEFSSHFTNFKDLNHILFTKMKSETTVCKNKKIKPGNKLFSNKLVFSYMKYGCKHHGPARITSTGVRPHQRSFKLNCPAYFTLCADKKRDVLVVSKACMDHNHLIAPDIYKHYPENRRMSVNELESVKQLLRVNVKVGKVVEHISSLSGKQLTAKDIHNIRSRMSGNEKEEVKLTPGPE